MQHVTGQELEELIKGDKTVFVDFWATWCAPCRMLAPIFEDVATKYDGKAVFVKLNVDEETETAIKYGVSSIPNIIAFRDGQPQNHSIGYTPEEELEEFVTENL